MTARRLEQTIQRAVIEHLTVRPAADIYWFHPANGGWRTRTEAAILKSMGVTAGTPDIFVVKDGKTFALELKAKDGKLSPAQRWAHAALRQAGAEVATATGLDAALAQLEAWGLLRGGVQ